MVHETARDMFAAAEEAEDADIAISRRRWTILAPAARGGRVTQLKNRRR